MGGEGEKGYFVIVTRCHRRVIYYGSELTACLKRTKSNYRTKRDRKVSTRYRWQGYCCAFSSGSSRYSQSRCFLLGPITSSVEALQIALARPCPDKLCLAALSLSITL